MRKIRVIVDSYLVVINQSIKHPELFHQSKAYPIIQIIIKTIYQTLTARHLQAQIIYLERYSIKPIMMLLQLLLIELRTLHKFLKTADCTKEKAKETRKKSNSSVKFKRIERERSNAILGLGNMLCETAIQETQMNLHPLINTHTM